jgi:glucan phosphorylase
MPLREPNGEWLRVEATFPGYRVWLCAWQMRVGRVRRYLLDSNNPANLPPHCGITSKLYGSRLRSLHPRFIEQYLGTYGEDRLGSTLQELLALGLLYADDASEPFNMAYLIAGKAYPTDQTGQRYFLGWLAGIPAFMRRVCHSV